LGGISKADFKKQKMICFEIMLFIEAVIDYTHKFAPLNYSERK